jgi:hypothetical protein
MKFLLLVPIVFLLAGCQAWISPISSGSTDKAETWIFVTKPAGDLERNGIYHCSSKEGTPVCAKATVKN